MASRVFLDANILLDLTLKREGFDKAAQIIDLEIQGHITLFTSSSIIHVVGYWLTKAYGHLKARELIISLLDEVQVLATNHDVIIRALESKMPDFEDAIQYHTAVGHGLDMFISRDKSLQKMASSALRICTPAEFLRDQEF